jgi:hypothetical protein
MRVVLVVEVEVVAKMPVVGLPKQQKLQDGYPHTLVCMVSDTKHRAGNEPSRARLGSARRGSVQLRAEPGSARSFCEPDLEARLGSVTAREPARASSRASH